MNVPRIAEFSCDRLYEQAIEDPEAKLYLPDAGADGKRNISRKFLFNGKLLCSLTPDAFLVIGTLRPNYFINEIQQAYKKRKEKHDTKTEQFIEMSAEMMQLVSASNQVSKGKHSWRFAIVVCR